MHGHMNLKLVTFSSNEIWKFYEWPVESFGTTHGVFIPHNIPLNPGESRGEQNICYMGLDPAHCTASTQTECQPHPATFQPQKKRKVHCLYFITYSPACYIAAKTQFTADVWLCFLFPSRNRETSLLESK